MDLRYYDGGYYGYLNEEVRMALGRSQAVTDNVAIVDEALGHLAVNQWEVGVEGLGVLGNTQLDTLRIVNLPTYADDAAAGVGGLSQNTVYKTPTGELRIKL